MAGDLFLEGYSGESLAEILALEVTHRLDSLVLAVESALYNRYEAGEDLSAPERSVLAVEAFERELNNGGFAQFFYNPSAEFADVLVASLEAIGCSSAASLAQEAINTLALDSLDAAGIEARMDEADSLLEDSLSQLDDAFYATQEDIASALFAFIKAHQANITLVSGN
ncbi:MAG: DUF4375 domain-containing protein [Deinococcota bacterium]